MAPDKISKTWSPYISGALTGLLAVSSVWLTGKFFGASTTFVRIAGMIEKIFMPDRVAAMDYFVKEAPIVEWQWMFVTGIFFGSLIAALTSGTYKFQAVPDVWKNRFGPNPTKRATVAFLGGIIAIFGARLADGCPSGHGLSGLMQLAVSGFIAIICFFVGGIIVAQTLYRGGEK
jgi:uncharacterized membrane protein YedE/YeeE